MSFNLFCGTQFVHMLIRGRPLRWLGWKFAPGFLELLSPSTSIDSILAIHHPKLVFILSRRRRKLAFIRVTYQNLLSSLRYNRDGLERARSLSCWGQEVRDCYYKTIIGCPEQAEPLQFVPSHPPRIIKKMASMKRIPNSTPRTAHEKAVIDDARR